jgi:hypothetical protein
MRRLLLATATLTWLLPSLLAALAAGPALALDCQRETEEEMARLGLGTEDISDIRYVEKYNPSETGPDVLGVRAWMRIKSCTSGYLVIDLTRTCFVRQSYTRGGCHLNDVTAY